MSAKSNLWLQYFIKKPFHKKHSNIAGKLIGKTRKQIIKILDDDYQPRINGKGLVYVVNKTVFNPRGYILEIEFDDYGEADTILMTKNYDRKKFIP